MEPLPLGAERGLRTRLAYFLPMMGLIRTLIEILAILANLALGLLCLALGALGSISGREMSIALLPVEPSNAATVLLLVGTFGITAACLAFRGRRWLRLPMLLWSAGLVVLMGSTVFRGSYRFDGLPDFTNHAWVFLGTVALLFASLLRFRARSSRSTATHTYRR